MIRPARPTDASAFAALGSPRSAPRSRTLVDEREGRVAGYIEFHTLGAIGYVRTVASVEPSHATDLMLAAAGALREAGVREWHVDARLDTRDALPSPELCEQLGMRAEHRSTALRFPWTRLDELPRPPVLALPVSATEDDDLERALDLLDGQLEMMRRRGGHVLVQLRDLDCAPRGLAAYAPAFGGARLFRVAHPSYAGALLAALRPLGDGDAITLVVDDDPLLVEMLVRCGAKVELVLAHFHGALPVVPAVGELN